jgi:hypothetical protein
MGWMMGVWPTQPPIQWVPVMNKIRFDCKDMNVAFSNVLQQLPQL